MFFVWVIIRLMVIYDCYCGWIIIIRMIGHVLWGARLVVVGLGCDGLGGMLRFKGFL